jgi:uncharacterized membrane protein YphA (DoxX/SURF4 family)
MKCAPSDSRLLGLALLVNRLLLGVLFIYASIGKFRMGVGDFYEKGFKPLAPSWLPAFLASPYGHAVPFLEMIVGVLLVLGLLERLTAAVAFLMIASFTIALCAKLGLSGGQPGLFHSNFFLMGLTFLLAAAGPGCCSVDKCLRGRCCCRKQPPTQASRETGAGSRESR